MSDIRNASAPLPPNEWIRRASDEMQRLHYSPKASLQAARWLWRESNEPCPKKAAQGLIEDWEGWSGWA